MIRSLHCHSNPPIEPMDGTSPEPMAPSVNAQEELHAVVGVDDATALRITVCDGHAPALVTSTAVWLESIDQPTTRQEKVSSTTAQYTFPRRYGAR
jgi:hypothetical protein